MPYSEKNMMFMLGTARMASQRAHMERTSSSLFGASGRIFLFISGELKNMARQGIASNLYKGWFMHDSYSF